MNVLQLQGKEINDDDTSCTGKQVAAVLSLVLSAQDFTGFSWYAAALVSYLSIDLCQHKNFDKITDISQLIEKIKPVVQLEDGVIIAIENGTLPITDAEFITAEAPTYKFVMQSLIEIRVFDTSWIEVYTEVSQIIVALQNRFGGRLRPSTDQPPNYF